MEPGGALLIGAVAGTVCIVGFVLIQPFLEKRTGWFALLDTRGVHNLHGLPGIVGALGSIVALSLVGTTIYGQPTSEILYHAGSRAGGFQAAAFGASFGIAILSGFGTGFIIWLLRLITPHKTLHWYSDENDFIVPADFEKRQPDAPTVGV